MAGKDILRMSRKEARRLYVIRKVLDGEVKQVSAAEMLSMSTRQIRRITERLRAEGEAGLIHKLRGGESNRKISRKVKDKIIQLYRKKYEGFGPALAAEKLSELDGLTINDETLRLWLIDAGEWKKARSRTAHRRWRERKAYRGEMVQIDGSHHAWF